MLEALTLKLNRHGPPSPEAHAALAAIMTPPRAVAAGQTIVHQFATPSESTLLISGLVGRRVTLRGGHQQITALQVAGDFVDLHAFLLNRMDHSVIALSDVIVCSAPHADLQRLSDRYPRMARALWYLTAVDASIHRHWLTVLGSRGAMGRVAHLICEMHVRLADVGLVIDDSFELALTQADSAEVLGLSAVHVNRVIQELRARGILTWNRRQVKIRKWAELCDLAEFEPTYLQRQTKVEI